MNIWNLLLQKKEEKQPQLPKFMFLSNIELIAIEFFIFRNETNNLYKFTKITKL